MPSTYSLLKSPHVFVLHTCALSHKSCCNLPRQGQRKTMLLGVIESSALDPPIFARHKHFCEAVQSKTSIFGGLDAGIFYGFCNGPGENCRACRWVLVWSGLSRLRVTVIEFGQVRRDSTPATIQRPRSTSSVLSQLW